MKGETEEKWLSIHIFFQQIIKDIVLKAADENHVPHDRAYSGCIHIHDNKRDKKQIPASASRFHLPDSHGTFHRDTDNCQHDNLRLEELPLRLFCTGDLFHRPPIKG